MLAGETPRVVQIVLVRKAYEYKPRWLGLQAYKKPQLWDKKPN